MTVTEMLNKVKAIFNAPIVPGVNVAAADPAAEPVAPVGKIYKLADGTEISIVQAGEQPAVGDSVTIAGAPAPEGEHALEDGSKITVDAGGIITVVTPTEPATQPDFVAPPTPTIEERMAAIEAALAKLQAPAIPAGMATEAQLTAASQRIEKQDEVIKGLFDLVEVMSKEPSDKPLTVTGAKKERLDKLKAKEEKFQSILNGIKNK